MFEGLFRPSHLLTILLIVLVVFGPAKLPHLWRSAREVDPGLQAGDRRACGRLPLPPHAEGEGSGDQEHRTSRLIARPPASLLHR